MSSTELELSTSPESHCNCIFCGTQNPAALGIQFLLLPCGSVRAEFKGNAFLQGYTGILHGGVIAGILDAAMTHCLFYNDIEAVTADLNVRYRKSIPYDADLVVTARIAANQRILFSMVSEIHVAGILMASARARFMNPASDSVGSSQLGYI